MSNAKKQGKSFLKSINFKKKVSEVKGKFIETLDLPRELSGEYTRTTMIENLQILIEGKNNIVDYTDGYIKIQTRTMYVQIDGKNLNIAEISNEEVLVTGDISNVGYISR